MDDSHNLTKLLHVGSKVKVHSRSPYHPNEIGEVAVMPKHPITWFRVLFQCGSVKTFRSSHLLPIDETTNEVMKDWHKPNSNTHTLRNTRKPAVSAALTSEGNIDSCDDQSRPTRKRSYSTSSIDFVFFPKTSLPPPKQRSAPNYARFDYQNACVSCGAVSWTAAKFCWNELCEFSPIFYKLPGCRGVDTDDAEAEGLSDRCDSPDSAAGVLSVLGSSTRGNCCSYGRRVRADSIVSTDSESCCSSHNGGSTDSLASLLSQ